MGLQKLRADIPGPKQSNGSTPWYARWMGGPSLALIRDCPIENADIPPRTVYITGEPDTWTSQPAACKYRGRRITGYITSDTETRDFVFRAHSDQDLPGHPAKKDEIK